MSKILQSKFSTALRAKFRRKFEFINVFCQTNGRLKCPIFQFDVHINSSEFSIQIFHFFKTYYPGWFEGKIVLLLSSCFFFFSLFPYLFICFSSPQQSEFEVLCEELKEELKAKDEEMDRVKEDKRDIFNKKVTQLSSYILYFF